MTADSKSMTSGPILGKLIKFAIPLVLTGILQQLYNTFDSVIIGKFSSSLALAGVGGSASLINLVINFFIGLSTGASIVAGQCFGAKDNANMKKVVHTAVALALVCGVLITGLGLAVLRPILRAIKTPEAVMPYAVKYTSVYFCGTLPTLLYNFLAGILRAIGDSKRPLYYLVISAALNIVLNLIFVIVLGMDVDGVAAATIISQTVCCILALYRLMRVDASYRIEIKSIRFDKKFLIKILRLGLPTGINSCLFSFSNLVIQSSVNSFGAAATAGCAADSNIENFIYMPMNAIGVAATTFVSQNKGAEEYERIDKGFKYSVFLVTAVGLVLGITVLVLGKPLLHLFTNEEEVVMFGMQRMMIIATLYFICGIMEVVGGTIRGMGEGIIPMLVSVAGVCGIRIFWIFIIWPLNRTLVTLFVSYPLSWFVTSMTMYIYFKAAKKRLQSI